MNSVIKTSLAALLLALLTACGGGGGGAKSLSISVPATSTPWDVLFNSKLPYGEYGASNSSAKSVNLLENSIQDNQSIFLQCSGGVTYLALPASIMMQGDCNGELNAIRGSHKNFPSLYVDGYNSLLPFKSMKIIASFSNNAGVIIGNPFVVDSIGINVKVPSGAVKIIFGFNDVYFDDNTGGLEVVVKY